MLAIWHYLTMDIIQSSIAGRGKRFLSFPRHPDRYWDPPDEYQRVFSGGKLPKREVDHTFVSSADVKCMWSYTSTLPHFFVA
jgi:hypothetical protein